MGRTKCQIKETAHRPQGNGEPSKNAEQGSDPVSGVRPTKVTVLLTDVDSYSRQPQPTVTIGHIPRTVRELWPQST